MAEKNFNNIRIVHKHDTEENWLKATGFVPKQGEIIVYDRDTNHSYERIKIGDGSLNVNNLPFIGDNAISSLSIDGQTITYTKNDGTEGSVQVIVDDTLSGESVNPIQNKVVNAAIGNLSSLVGDTSVADQIANATYTQSQVNDLIAAVKAACMPRVKTVTLFVDEWRYDRGEYYYDIQVSGMTANSQVSLQADAASLAILQDDGIALVPVTYSSYVRIWTVGGSPREDLTIQITVQEVTEV